MTLLKRNKREGRPLLMHETPVTSDSYEDEQQKQRKSWKLFSKRKSKSSSQDEMDAWETTTTANPNSRQRYHFENTQTEFCCLYEFFVVTPKTKATNLFTAKADRWQYSIHQNYQQTRICSFAICKYCFGETIWTRGIVAEGLYGA
jgi:hypothetical protein